MRIRIDMSPRNGNPPSQASERRAVRRSEARSHIATPTHPRTLVLLIGCLITSVAAESLVQAQATSGSPRSSRTAKAAPRQEMPTDTAMTTPQAASPNANYALSSLSSRTAEPSGTDDTSVEINNVLARRLWQNRILAPDPNEDAETRNALRRLIQQVHSVTFDGNTTEPTFSAPLEPTIKIEGTAAETTDTMPSGQEQSVMAVPLPSGQSLTPLPAETLTQLEDLLADPNQVSDPFEMAELLFLSGRATKAAFFYEKALAQIPANDVANGGDRAWILFQLGNCLRETNQTKAKDTYMKLIAQYPNSPWTELAKAHGRLISWYQSAKPQQLLASTE